MSINAKYHPRALFVDESISQTATKKEPSPLEKIVDEYKGKLAEKQEANLAHVLAAVIRIVTCDHDQPAIEMLEEERDELRHKLVAVEARAVEAERQLERMIAVAERYAPCPFILFLDSAQRLYKEACRTCSPVKDLRLECLKEYAAQKDGDV